MRAAIAALGKAQALINERTDKAIEHGLASMDLVQKVTASADAVSSALSDFQKVGSSLGSHDGDVVASAP
jgi:thiamine biosynthesis lipoprotein ApbE